ncbi:MAG TPA: phosphodiester glycosidase family protein [Patescibacteria group bacterium]|nr:phosphodiester glycosidase family protein [Patescibacteria group bacterium]
MKKGFIPIVLLILVPFIIALVYIAIKRGEIKIGMPTPVPTVSTIPTESSTPTPSPSPIPTPKITPTPVVTVKPTLPPVSGPPGTGVSTINVHTEKGDFTATVMSFDLGSTRVITDSANDSDCTSACPVDNLADFVSKNGGFAGVNGTYFCPAEPAYASCGQNNSFDFSFYNTRLNHWINQGNLGYSGRSIVYFDGSGAHYMQNASGFGGGLTAGIVMSPGLVDGGNVQIDDNQSGLSDKQKAVGLKEGIGIIGTNKVMIVVAQSVNMEQFAYVFKALSATGAMNLDEGGSTAMYYQGRYVFGPGRNIPNAVVFANK